MGGGEEVEVGVDFGLTADSGSSAAVTAEHEVTEFAFDLWADRPVVGPPVRVGLLLAGFGEGGFVTADFHGPSRS